MEQLTDNEVQLLKAITEDDFYQEGVDSELWADVFFDWCGMDTKIARGVMSSLVRKGYVEYNHYPCEHETFDFIRNAAGRIRQIRTKKMHRNDDTFSITPKAVEWYHARGIDCKD